MKHQQTNILYNTTMNNEFKPFHDKLHNSHHHYSEDAMNMSPLENSLLYAQDRGAPTSYFTPSTNPINWSERILQDIVGFLHILSPVGKVLYCSESCLELIGYHPQELIGKSLTEFLHPDDIDMFTTNLQQAFNAPTSVKLHYRIRGKSNSFLLVESIGQPKQILADRLHQAFIAIAQPYIPRSDGLLDSYLQMKMENEWLKKQLNNAMLTQTSSPASAADFSSTVDYHHQQQQHMNYQQQQQQQPIHHSNYYIPPPSSSSLHTSNNNYENTADYSMPYYPSQSFKPFDRANNTNNDLMMGTHPHYYMNNESPHISSRRQSNCSSIMYQTNNNTTTPTKDDTLNNPWCPPAKYSPSVASSSEQNEKNSRFGQQEEMDLPSVGLATTSSNDSSTTGHVKKEKWRRRKSRGTDDYVCADCGTTASPEWRKGPQGPKTLCNACGLRWAKKNKKI